MDKLPLDIMNDLADAMPYNLLGKLMEVVQDHHKEWAKVIKAHLNFRYDLRVLLSVPPELEETENYNMLVSSRKSTFRSQGMIYKDWDRQAKKFARLSRLVLEGSPPMDYEEMLGVFVSAAPASWNMNCFKNTKMFPRDLDTVYGMLDVTAGPSKKEDYFSSDYFRPTSKFSIRCFTKYHTSILLKILHHTPKNFERVGVWHITEAPELVESIVKHFSDSLNLKRFGIRLCGVNDDILGPFGDLFLQNKNCTSGIAGDYSIRDHNFAASAVDAFIDKWTGDNGEWNHLDTRMRLEMTEEESEKLVAGRKFVDQFLIFTEYIVPHPSKKCSLKIMFEPVRRRWGPGNGDKGVTITVVGYCRKRRHEEDNGEEGT